MLVWALRVMAGACLIVLILQLSTIEETATSVEKQTGTRPNTGGQVLGAVLTTVGAMVVLLALAEILKLLMDVTRKMDQPWDEEPEDNVASTGAATPPDIPKTPMV
jgi:hypothetical protein